MTEKRTGRTQSGSSNTKRTGKSKNMTRKRKTTSGKKGSKVYVPLNKVILLCACIVLVCTILLVVTQSIDSKKASEIRKEFAQVTEQKISGVEDAFIHKEKKSGKIEKSGKDGKKSAGASDKSGKSTAVSRTDAERTEKKASSGGTKPASTAKTSSATKSVSETKTQEAAKSASVKAASAVSQATSASSASETNSPSVKPASSLYSDFPEATGAPVLVFIFDDGGQNLNHLEKFISIPFEITVAVLPGLAHTRESAERVRKSGNELMLHQPMQAVNLSVNPGPGAITPDMNEEQVRSILFNNLYEIGPVSGVNNHEGSLITADAEKMSWIMKLLSDEGLYFLDSRTNVETKVPYVASSLGYSYYQRNIFLDNTKNRDDILFEIKKGLEYANKNGSAIMIGHVWSADILPEILTELYPFLVQKGYRFKTVSKSGAIMY